MKIKVLKTTKAATCKLGINTTKYIAGQTYEIYNELAKIFIKQGWGEDPNNTKREEQKAERAREAARLKAQKEKAEAKAILAAKIENKAIEVAEENKAVEVAEENKAKEKKTRKNKRKGKL